MSDQQSIVAIFDILNNSAPVTPAARKTIDNISSTFPYFIPARYIKALDSYRRDGNMNNVQSLIAGYSGNWILFYQFLIAQAPAGSGDSSYSSESNPTPAATAESTINTTREKSTLPARKPSTDPLDMPAPVVTPVMDATPVTPFTHNFTEVEDAIVEEIEIPAPGGATMADAANSEQMQAEADALIQEFLNKNSTAEPAVVEETEAHPSNEQISEAMAEVKAEHGGGETHAAFAMGPASEPTVNEPVAETNTAHSEIPVVENPVFDEELVKPVYTDDYFMQQGVHIPSEMPSDINEITTQPAPVAAQPAPAEVPSAGDEDKSLMVMMSFEEWLLHFKQKEVAHEEEKEDKKALKTMWQKEKLAAAMEEENEEIPEEVFDLAMNSIAKEDGLASESLAEIHIKQGKFDKAIEMFEKLSLRNPEKSTYFARKIEELKKDNII